MKKYLLATALVSVMVFGIASQAFADHSPQFYFDFQSGTGVTSGARFQQVFPTSWDVAFSIDNGSSPHDTYAQTTAKCAVCHSVHRAPAPNTSSKSTMEFGGAANTSSRYAESTWTAQVPAGSDTQLLLKSTAAGSCLYCHVSSGAKKMFGGDASLLLFGEGENSWNEFYSHTTGCTSCHAVHGAYTFKGNGVSGVALKYQGVKKLGTIPLVVEPEVYSNSPLYASFDDMKNGIVKPAALAAGVTPLSAAVTAQCSICHANYSPASNQLINGNWMNPNLFQSGSWDKANGKTTGIFVGTTADPVASLPGTPGLTYTNRAFTGAPGSLIMSYKNHPMKSPDALFTGAGASSGVSGLVSVASKQSLTCQSCHDAPTVLTAGYYVSSFPHYTPGYYKFMRALDQNAFDTPVTIEEVMLGREEFFDSGFGTDRDGKPAVMNDGYCKKCHATVGTMY